MTLVDNVRRYRVEQINDEHQSVWRQIQSQNDLLQHPLLCFEYAETLARVRDDVEVAVLFADSKPVGYFPYHRFRNTALPLGDTISDYHAVVVANDTTWNPCRLIQQLNLKSFHFDHLPTIQQEWKPFVHHTDPAYWVDLRDGLENYIKAKNVSSSMIKNIERKRRKLEREVGPIRFESVCHDIESLNQLVRWKQEHLRRQGFRNPFDQDWVYKFTRALSNSNTPTFSGMMSALYAGKHLVAGQFGCRTSNILCSWLPSYSPEFAGYSPGNLLVLELIKFAAQAGVKHIDLGRGENQQKALLANQKIWLAIGGIGTGLRQRLRTSLKKYGRLLTQRYPALKKQVRRVR